MRAILFPLVAVALASSNFGCISDSWSYRVVHNVRVNESNTELRNGPLTLSPADSTPAAPTTAPSLSNAMLQQKMAARSKAKDNLDKLQRTMAADHPEVIQQKQLVAALDGEIAQLTQQAAARQAAAAIAAKPKTILMVALDHSGPGRLTIHPGGDLVDRYSRVLVLMLDQPLPDETIWLSDDNSMMIEYSPNTPPQRSYTAVEGSVKIVSVKGDDVIADMKLKFRSDVEDLDATLFRFPYKQDGRKRFVALTPGDALYKTGPVRWVAQPGAPSAVAPTTRPSVVTAE